MSFQLLPIAIQDQILKELGTCFFKEDISHLTVCKEWYIIALKIIRTDVHLGLNGVMSFVKMPLRNRDLWECVEEWTKTQMKSLTITLDDRKETWNIEGYNEDADESFSRIQATLYLFEALDEFTLRLYSHFSAPGESGYYNQIAQFHMALKLPNGLQRLSYLELDLCGCLGMSCSGNDNLCQLLNWMLYSLRRLRVRLLSICPRLLSISREMPETLALEELIINTDLRIGHGDGNNALARTCNGGFDDPCELDGLARAARRIVPRMSNPKIAKILWWDVSDPSSVTMDSDHSDAMNKLRLSYDCLTGKTTRGPLTADWSDDGGTETENLEWASVGEDDGEFEEYIDYDSIGCG